MAIVIIMTKVINVMAEVIRSGSTLLRSRIVVLLQVSVRTLLLPVGLSGC